MKFSPTTQTTKTIDTSEPRAQTAEQKRRIQEHDDRSSISHSIPYLFETPLLNLVQHPRPNNRSDSSPLHCGFAGSLPQQLFSESRRIVQTLSSTPPSTTPQTNRQNDAAVSKLQSKGFAHPHTSRPRSACSQDRRRWSTTDRSTSGLRALWSVAV